MDTKTIKITPDGGVVEVRLARPEVHNAFDSRLIGELTSALETLAADSRCRVLILSGEGKNFCAGADINWMRESIRFSRKENEEDALRMHRMLQTLDDFHKPTVGRIQGATFGGGVGLIACCDVAVATDRATFCLSETRLGILPAVISPFVARKIGVSGLRTYGLSARRFAADEALRIGLIQESVPPGELDGAVRAWVDLFLANGPEAMATLKQLSQEIAYLSPEDASIRTAKTIARARTGSEGQEGLKAFLEKRQPGWRNSKKPGT